MPRTAGGDRPDAVAPPARRIGHGSALCSASQGLKPCQPLRETMLSCTATKRSSSTSLDCALLVVLSVPAEGSCMRQRWFVPCVASGGSMMSRILRHGRFDLPRWRQIATRSSAYTLWSPSPCSSPWCTGSPTSPFVLKRRSRPGDPSSDDVLWNFR